MIAIGRLQDILLALKEEAMPLTWTSVSSAGVARGRILLNLLPPRRDQGGLGGEQGGRSSDGQEGYQVVWGVQGGQGVPRRGAGLCSVVGDRIRGLN